MSAFCADVLGAADGSEIARRIVAREIHPREAVLAAIERAERVNPVLNAIAARCFDAARDRAERARPGVFCGVPTFIKDTDAVAGLPLRYGSRALPGVVRAKNSRFIDQFLSTGLICLGTTTMPELGLTGTTESIAHGPTHNPYQLGISPGGSSGGSAALVASGVVPLAHANDGGGSTRIPAACCGLVGLKPSRGRLVATEGSGLLPIGLLHQGMLSRSVRDTAAFYAGAESFYRNRSLPPIGRVNGPGPRLRVGWFSTLDERTQVHPDCVAAAARAARLCENLGHHVEEIRAPCYARFHDDFFMAWALLGFALVHFGRVILHSGFDKSGLEPFSTGLARHFAQKVRQLPQSLLRLRQFARSYAESFERHDVLLCPTLGLPPPAHGFVGPDVPFATALARLREFIPFTPIQNVTGTPAISLPLASNAQGLPIGVQFAAALGRERTLLELAFELEAAAPWWGCSSPEPTRRRV